MFKYLLVFCCLFTIPSDVENISITRPAKTENNIKVGNYIITNLKSLGLQVSEQEFNSGTNIIAIQKGKINDTIIIGAHYDSVSTTPGADDNASGCALVLDLAKKLSKIKRFKYTIKYIFFDAEEKGLLGSSYYSKHMKEKCIFMVNFDMVGHLKIKSSPNETLNNLFIKYPWAKDICFREGNQSDHTSFLRKGIPVVWIFTGTHNRYHRPTDTPDTLNYEGMKQISQFAEELIIKIAKKDDAYDFFINLPPLKEKH